MQQHVEVAGFLDQNKSFGFDKARHVLCMAMDFHAIYTQLEKSLISSSCKKHRVSQCLCYILFNQMVVYQRRLHFVELLNLIVQFV